ncbi:MarR family winged helix-turn-helix transcriptional regulator [Thermodesulfitimonas sp.]
MGDLKRCREMMEEVMRLFARRLYKALLARTGDSGEWSSETAAGRRIPLLAAAGGGAYYFLRAVEERGRATVSEVALDLGVTLAAVTALAKKLVRVGWVTRQRDERDRRVVWLALSPEGKKVLAAVEVVRGEVFSRYFGGLGDKEIETLIGIMDQVRAKLTEEGWEGEERK